MSHWSFYFLAKLGLFHAGRLDFHWQLNLLLALALLWPLAPGRMKTWRVWLAWPLALALLYYDSYLPPIGRVLAQIPALTNFRLDYLGELLGRTIEGRTVLGALAAFAIYLLLARRIRFATVAFVGILSVPLSNTLLLSPVPASGTTTQASSAPGTAGAATPTATQDPDSQLQAFYASEARRTLHLSANGATPPFDIIVLQVCSLSWDDLDLVGMRDNPLFKRFDAVFSRFNSAASYSGPAALRLARGACGQVSHHDLYEGADPACYLFPSLERLGYHTHGLLNHDGAFDDFAKTLETRAGLAGALELPSGVPVTMHSFDGSPIYADGPLLSRWWHQRLAQGAQPAALYYNTITLHDGNRIDGVASRSSLDTYKPRLTRLLADFDQFITELETTDRPVVLLMIPEHGAGLRGDRFQISGMREIPNPRITQVPAALKIIGLPKGQHADTVVVDRPVSYFDINALVLDMLQHSPFAAGSPSLADRLKNLQTTTFVAENDDVVMMREPDGKYLMRTGKSAWVDYTP